MDKKFDSWCQLPAPVTAAVDVKKASGTSTASLPPAVAAFEVRCCSLLYCFYFTYEMLIILLFPAFLVYNFELV